MAGKVSDRKKGGKDTKSTGSEMNDNLAAFTLPDSLPCSEVEFPVLIKRRAKVKWSDILEESDQKMQEIVEYEESTKIPTPKSPFLRSECDYIKNEVFLYLLPALEETLNKAKLWDALGKQKCFFNGIDHIAQLLWNNNPRHPYRLDANAHIFNMRWARKYLETHPRPYYPKSWLWPEDYAATLIQKTVRQYFVQRDEEVQEMRNFWRKLEVEKHVPDMEMNPFLAKLFASQPNFGMPRQPQPPHK